MTRKDYELIARAIAADADTSTLVQRIADALASDNAAFDKARFLKAAGA